MQHTLRAVFSHTAPLLLTPGDSAVIRHPDDAAEAFARLCEGKDICEVASLVRQFEGIQDDAGNTIFDAASLVTGFHHVSVSHYIASIQATNEKDRQRANDGHKQAAFMVGAFGCRVRALDAAPLAR